MAYALIQIQKETPPQIGSLLCECIQTVIHKGGFSAIPHLRHMSQINITQRPHSPKDRATLGILQFPPVKAVIKARSCGSITFYASRLSIAATKGNVMINANSTTTRCVRTALTTLCNEVTIPLGHNTDRLPATAAASALYPPPALPKRLTKLFAFWTHSTPLRYLY